MPNPRTMDKPTKLTDRSLAVAHLEFAHVRALLAAASSPAQDLNRPHRDVPGHPTTFTTYAQRIGGEIRDLGEPRRNPSGRGWVSGDNGLAGSEAAGLRAVRQLSHDGRVAAHVEDRMAPRSIAAAVCADVYTIIQ